MIDVMMFFIGVFVLISLNVIPALGLKTQLPSAGSARQHAEKAEKRSSRWGPTSGCELDGQPRSRSRRVG